MSDEEVDYRHQKWKETVMTGKQERAKANTLRVDREQLLLAALNRAVSEWEYASSYKGEYLVTKHGDVESIELFRRLFGLTDETGMLMDDGKII